MGQLVVNPGGANPTPVQVATLQDVSLDLAFAEKKLYGGYQLPVDIARAEANFAIKAKFATISGQLIASFLAGSTNATGFTAGAINEAGVIPTTPFQITVANSATFVTDNGVIDLTAGIALTRVASAPATGQYSVSAGLYTFAAADVGHSVWISYSYTVAGSGKTVTYLNQLMGQGVSYSAYLFNIFRSKVIGFQFFAVTVPKLNLPLKNADYTIADLDMGIYADGTNQVMKHFESDF